MFQSTLPRGERPCDGNDLTELSSFNPRSRAGSDWRNFLFSPVVFMFQSTLPRGERRNTLHQHHRSTKFQSTLPRGERLRIFRNIRHPGSFNPRSRAGSDARLLDGGDAHAVSIHAPARGATQAGGMVQVYFLCFNPRSRAGSDRPRRGRACGRDRFNPRSRAGSDLNNSGQC